MKKLIIILFVVGLISCSKDDGTFCTTCRESNTGVEQKFCGTRSSVKAFKDTIKKNGAYYGQNWTCN